MNYRYWRLLAAALLANLGLVIAACTPPEERAASYVAAAEKFFAEGDINKAGLEARNALQIQPKNAQARYLLARVARQKGETGQEVNHLSVVLEVDPQNMPAKVRLGTLLVFAQDYDGANLLADEALAAIPDDPEAHVLKARVQVQKQQLEEALGHLDRAIELAPRDQEAAALRALTYGIGDTERGLKELDAAIERIGSKEAEALRRLRVDILGRMDRPKDVEAELLALIEDFPTRDYRDTLAAVYVNQGRLDDAEKMLRAQVEALPDEVAPKANLAQFQSRYRQQPEQAEKTLKDYIASDPDNLQLPVFLGSFYEGTGRPDEARAAYQKVAEKAPDSTEGLVARNRIAALLLKSGEVEAARERLEGILKDAPDNTEALLARGEVNYATGNYEQAIADLRGVLRRDPENALGLLLLGKAHTAAGDRPLAQDAYRRLLQGRPNDAEALSLLATLVGEDRQFDEAQELFDRALRADPQNARALEGMVAVLLAKGDLKAAEERARALAGLESDTSGIGYRELGRVLEAQNRLPEATRAYRQALEKKSDSAVSLEGVVRTLEASKRSDEAAAFLREHLEAHPDHVVARYLLGGSLARNGQMDQAREMFNQAIAQQPGMVRAYIGLAATYPDDPEKRIDAYKRGIQAAPNSPALTNQLAAEYQRTDRPDEAVIVYEAFLARNEDAPAVANNFAVLLLDQRSDPESHKRALEIAKPFANSQVPMLLDTLGWAYYRNKDFDSAIRFLEVAAAYGGREPEIRYHLGMAYLATDNKVGARQELERAVKEGNPSAAWVEDARKTLEGLGGDAPAASAAGTG